MSGLELGSLRRFFNNIYTKLRTSEELMRLLHYPPENYSKKYPDPLDKSLPDLVDDSEKYWDLVEKLIITGTKSTDIEEKGICRLYIYPGRRRPRWGNFLIADQEVVIDILVHESYNKDMRMEWLIDTISKLIVLERVAGYGQLELTGGNPRPQGAAIGYSKYELVFSFGENKK